MTVSSNVPVFKTCGIEFPSIDEQPDSVNIVHSIPKGYDELAKERAEGSRCDVTIIVGDKKLYAHKTILIARIPFFRNLFNSNMVECEKGEINLSSAFCDFNIATLESLLNYAYTGCLTIAVSNVQDLMMGALYFNISQHDYVLEECARFMWKRLSVDNVISILRCFRGISYNKFDTCIFRFIDRNFVPISFTPEFLELSVVDLEFFLRRDSLYVNDERQVFEVATRWMEHAADRAHHAARLLKCVRCTLLTEAFIAITVEKRGWVMCDSECMDLLKEAKKYIRGRGTTHSFNATKRVEAHRLIFAIGSEDPMQLYDPLSNTWTACLGLKFPIDRSPRWRGAVAVNDGKIYMFGGRDSSPCIYDTVKNELIPMSQISGSKYYLETGVINGIIYATSGFDQNKRASTMKAFNISSNVWLPSTPLTMPRNQATSCVLDGKLYVIGGCHFHLVFADGECYDPKTDSWRDIPDLHIARAGAAAAVLNGQIYVAGGYNRSPALCEVEKYDPITKTWTPVKSMNHKRRFLDLVASCGKLFVFGGFSGGDKDEKMLSSVEMYEPETDSWEEVAPLQTTSEYVLIGSLTVPAACPWPVANQTGEFDQCHGNGFRSFLLKDELLRAIADCVQHQFIPLATRGLDLMCGAKCGTGKTTLSTIAALHQLEPVEGEVSVLVLCPTRESAAEVGQTYANLSKYMPEIKVAVFTGDERLKKNRSALKNACPNIVIGTPGRILVLAQSGLLKLNKIKYLVLDDCDRMFKCLDIRVEVQKIVKFAPQKKQVMMVSEYFSEELKHVCKEFMHEENAHDVQALQNF